MSTKALIARLRDTLGLLEKAVGRLEEEVRGFEAFTETLVDVLGELNGRWREQQAPKNRLPSAVTEVLKSWWHWWILLRDSSLEIYNGELRHGNGLQGRELRYVNDLKLRQSDMLTQEGLHKHNKRYSGQALDDYLGGMSKLAKVEEASDSIKTRRLVENAQEELEPRDTIAQERLKSLKDKVKAKGRLLPLVKQALEAFPQAKTMQAKLAVTVLSEAGDDLREVFELKAFAIRLTRPKEKGWGRALRAGDGHSALASLTVT